MSLEPPGNKGQEPQGAGESRMHRSKDRAAARASLRGPRELIVRVSGSLDCPAVDPVSPLVVRSKAHEILCRRACHSSGESLQYFLREMMAANLQATKSYPGLRDELSPYVADRLMVQRDRSMAKTLREFAVYSRMLKVAEGLPQFGQSDFVELLLEIHRRLGAGPNTFRSGPVRTKPDGAGNRVIYPHHCLCGPLIHELHSFVHLHIRQNAALCAIVAYVGINQAHPFADGNGRTARTAYNLIMATAGSRHFLPIYCFNALAGRSLIIKVRRAMYGGDWEPLLTFFADATRLSDRVQRAQVDGDGKAMNSGET